jgi:hypothetical protein
MNRDAIKINEKLGVKLFDEIDGNLNKFTKKQIRELMIDDLVDLETRQPTVRLIKFMKEILLGVR